MRKTVILLGFLAACATPPPASRWRDPGALEVPLASRRPPTVQVTVEGDEESVPARLMLDTGAEESALDERIVERLGLGRAWRLDSVAGLSREQGGVGRKLVFQHEAKAVELAGTCRLENLRVLPLPMPGSRDGVFSLAAFPGRAVILDPARKTLAFVPSSRVAELANREGSTHVPVRREGNLLVARVLLRANEATWSRDMLLDTGAGDSFLTREALEETGLRPQGEEICFGVRLGSVAAGTHPFRIERQGDFCTLGGDVLLEIGRPILFDLEGARVVLLPEGYSISKGGVSSPRVVPETE